MNGMLNPVTFGLLLIIIGFVFVSIARYQRNISIRPKKYGATRLIGIFLSGAGLILGVYYLVFAPSWNKMRLDILSNKPIPEKFIFVPIVYAKDRECLEIERDLCLFFPTNAFPEHYQFGCLKDPRELKGTFSEVIKDPTFIVPAEAFILNGKVEYEPLTGLCELRLARVNRDMVSQGPLFNISFGCAFRTPCE
ncbi:MAG: hypothetical protein HQL78_04825 [Magnetococcales bacterium]|nr:hypothetical protein [Magnetococcales bacterium]